MFAKGLLFSWRLFSFTVNIQLETFSSDVIKTFTKIIKEQLQALSKTFSETSNNLQRNPREKCYTQAEHISYSSHFLGRFFIQRWFVSHHFWAAL